MTKLIAFTFSISLLALAGCSGTPGSMPEAPAVTVTSATGTTAPVAVTTPNAIPATATPLEVLRIKIGNDLSLDDAATLNAAQTDPLGLKFAQDIQALINAAAQAQGSGGTGPTLGTLHIMYTHEELRLKLIQASAAGNSNLFMQAFVDGNALIQDDIRRGIEVANEFKGLVAQLGVMATGVAAQNQAAVMNILLP